MQMLLPILKSQKGSLTQKTLVKMSIRIAIVIILTTLISYLHLVSVLKSQTLEQLEKYILERGQRESSIFTLAQDNHLVLKKELYRQLEKLGDQDPHVQFEQLFVKWSDGIIRNRPKDMSPQDFDTMQEPSVFIGKQVEINADIRRRVFTFYNLLSAYGPAWRNRFVDTYIIAPENIVLNYWPGEPWALNAPANLNIRNEEYFYVSDQKHNPERKSAWTGLYFDHVVKLWMVSVETPVDDAQGRHIATIGNDIILNELMERTIHDTYEGAYNLILRTDGRLIAEPHKMMKIQEQGGQFDIIQSGDQHLLHIFELVKNIQPNQVIIENTMDNEYLAVTKIAGPEWYFITVYPKSLLTKLAFKTARFILILGIISLLIEVFILFWVLRTQVAKPLHEFIFATQQIAVGNFSRETQSDEPGYFVPHPLPVERSDELGQLANAFNQMAEQLKTSFDTLETKNAEFREVIEDIVHVSHSLANGNLRVTLRAKYQGELLQIKHVLETALSDLHLVTEDIVQVSQGLASGNLHITPTCEYRGDFIKIKTALESALSDLRHVIQDIINVSQGLAEGNLCNTPQSQYRGEFVQIKHALEAALFNQRLVIEDIVQVSQELAEGNFNITPKSEYLGEFIRIKIALEKAATKMTVATNKTTLQDWLKTGQNQLNEQISGEQNIAGLTHNIVSFLTHYLEVQVGLCYLIEGSFERMRYNLSLSASYAQTRRKNLTDEFEFSEGLIRRTVREQKSIILTINTGLDKAIPQHIAVIPFLYENAVKGVILLGSLQPLTDIQLDFLHQIMPSIGIAVNSIESRTKMHELLQQTQIQAEELQSQQEILQQTNEELKTQSEELQTQAEELQSQAEELRQTNEELEERTQELERQRNEIGDKNLILEQTQKAIEMKAKELEVASQYKSEFLANVSHELRTPLNSLLILAQLLVDNSTGNLTDKQVEYVQTIHSAGSDLLLLINDILDLSKVEAGKFELNIEEVLVTDLQESVEKKFRPLADEKQLVFQINVADDMPSMLRTDAQRLKQIINNLLSNAFKFTSQGEIRLDMQRSLLEDSSLGIDATHTVAISVTDTGVGIPQAKQKIIFEAFRQTDGTISRRYGGTGLGLSISRQLAQLLEGKLQLQSEEGKGSTFTLYLPETISVSATVDTSSTLAIAEEMFIPSGEMPVETSTSPQTEVILAKESQSTPQKIIKSLDDNVILTGGIIDDRTLLTSADKTVLIIENDLQFASILMALAQERDFKSLIAEDGQTGLQLAQQYLPDAIILGIDLPHSDGWSIMKGLKDNLGTRPIPVYVISAMTDPNMKAKKMGAIGFSQKPINMVQLREIFKKIELFGTKVMKNLLIVVDNETHQQNILAIVSGRNIEITQTITKSATLQHLRTAQFDCIILDIDIENGSGLNLLEQMKAEQGLCQTPVIICAGRELTPTEEILLQQCANKLTVKSVSSPDRLLDEATLFLHQLEANLSKEDCNFIRMVHDKEAILHRKKVLIADDDMRNTFALATVLEDKQMEVIVARDGKEALLLLNKHEDTDIVLIDIMMPEMDGYETIQEIRKQPRYRNIPIVALTAKAMKGDKAKCIEAGANEYISKPIETDKLISVMRVWLYR